MASAAPPPPRSRLRRVVVTSLKVFAYLLVISLVALAVAVSVAVSQLPSYGELLRRDDLGQMVRVRAVDGTIIHSMGPSFGEWLSYDEIPPIMRDAMVAVEDRRFRSHPGIDPISTVRGIWVGWTEGDRVRGVSTITQQLARNIFLTNDRSFVRKVREGILALALEWRFSKDQILELYLNRVYFGGGAYGIDAASRRFFGHSATTLSIPEAAIIAGLVKAPSNYSPTADTEAARDRARVVIDLMVRNGTITPAQAAASDPEEVEITRTAERQNITRYFIDWVLPQLDMMIDEAVQPIDVWTTIDVRMQRAAVAAINAHAPQNAQGALISLDRDGAVRAMVGGRDYVNSSYNRATQATRQPGSSFKLFVYLTAIEAGYQPDNEVQDAPITIGGWSPRNSNGGYAGPVSVRQAFAMSINTVAVRLAQEVGTRAVADMAQRFGITTRVDTNPSMALGSSEVRRDRHDARLCCGRPRRRCGDALWRPPGHHHRRHPPLPASGPRAAGAGRALGRGGDDRSAAVGGRQRHRPLGRARPADRRQDRDDLVEQGRLVHRLFERAHHRGLDGPRRQSGAARPRRRPGAGPRLPRLYDRARSPTGRSRRSRPRLPRPIGRWRATTRSGSRRPTTSLSSTPTATRSSASRRPRRSRARTPRRATRRTSSSSGSNASSTSGRSIGRGRRAVRRPRRASAATPTEIGDCPRLSEAMEGGALALQPGPRRLRIGAEQALDQRVEIGAVVEVDEVGDLVRDRGAADLVRREDQPPAVADRARGGAAPPARDRIADPDP